MRRPHVPPFHKATWMFVLLVRCSDCVNLYGTSGFRNQASYLWKINRVTGVGSRIGAIVVNGFEPVTVNGLAFDRKTGGTMYAHTDGSSAFYPNHLITIDLNSGAATVVGPSGVPGVIGLAVDNFGDIYAFATRLNENTVIDDLVKLDPLTGKASIFETDSGISVGDPPYFGMDFDRDVPDTLHVVNRNSHYTMNLSSGRATLQGVVASSKSVGFGALDPDSTGLRFWAPEITGETVDVNTNIFVYNLDSRTVSQTIGSNIDNLRTLAFTFEISEMPSLQPSTSPSSQPSGSSAPTVSAAPSSPDPCQRNECEFDFLGAVISGRQIRVDILGYCYSKCTFPLLAAFLTWVGGWNCGGC